MRALYVGLVAALLTGCASHCVTNAAVQQDTYRPLTGPFFLCYLMIKPYTTQHVFISRANI